MKIVKCSRCNQEHKFYYDMEFTLPKVVLSELQSNELQYESSERWFSIEEKYFFIKGLIEIDIKEKENFNWLVWVMVDKNTFKKYINFLSLENSNNDDLKFKGVLSSEIDFFEKSLGLKVLINDINNHSYPKVNFEDNNSQLGSYQSKGLTEIEAISFLEAVYHS